MVDLTILPPEGEFLLYTTEDGETRLEVRLNGETVWLNQAQMAELFQTSKQNVGQHIRNVFNEGELQSDSVVKDFFTTASDGKNYSTRHYNLDVIISVGYRVKSQRGTQFRIWATQRLREYLIKGFAMDDERLKQNGGGNYFDELLQRIRDIRSSEKVFWRKVLDIYATSIDYEGASEQSKRFFATVQNKMHWAAHGHTASEVVFQRADASLPNMGMTSFSGNKPTKTEASVAKNYLTSEELDTLNRIVNLYLEFAELQALNRKPMYMADWIRKLDDFLRVSDRDILQGAGKVSHEQALQKAQIEFDKYRQTLLNAKSPVEVHFDAAIKQLKTLERSASKKKEPKA
ncbi:virulence RhuM family protein [Chitinibacter fontanus]|uniref:Virulence RhuM family protein n=1 Tax=Chitinibacter fontanus TaxID=1737446 RepID=A0A7D5ZHW7_9NEIS|nr:virulence RhuM family protein [Chitinibacter fontanus]QLI82648.1 virulence RhuM family protein [Chitinibacter fontanus]